MPPIHFNRVPYAGKIVAGQPALVLHPVDREPPSSRRNQPPAKNQSSPDRQQTRQQSSDSPIPCVIWPKQTKLPLQLPKVKDFHIQADFSQRHVLLNLKELADQLIKQQRRGSGSAGGPNDVMFIISDLQFKDYLSNSGSTKYKATLPKPSTFPSKDHKSLKQGDFDILIITRNRGILVGELKSVGMSEKGRSDADVTKKVTEAIEQVDKSEEMMKHLVGDIAPNLTVRKTLFLPYVSRQQLHRVLSADPDLEKVSPPPPPRPPPHTRTFSLSLFSFSLFHVSIHTFLFPKCHA